MFDKTNIPRHIAFIMDGNGRWAKLRGLPRSAGHRKGINNVKEIVKAADSLGIKVVTFFAFSTENWSRPKKEVDMLMRSLDRFLKNQASYLNKNNIKLSVIGRKDPIPAYLQESIIKVIENTKNNTGLILNIALNYGSRSEIVDAVKKIAGELLKNNLNLEDINEETFGQFLYTKDLPDPALLIRTSGEQRISNFLLWQLSYAELYFSKKFWPDFDKKELIKAIKDYEKRERRFGRINAS